MIKALKTTIHLGLVLGLVGVLPLAAQEPEKVDPAEIERALTELETTIKGQVKADQIHFIKVLAEKWSGAEPKQMKEAHKLATWNLKSKEREIREATVEALGSMGGGEREWASRSAVRILIREADDKANEKDMPMRIKCLQSVGQLKSKDGADELMKLMKDKNNEVIGASIDSLRHYHDAEFKMRREIVEEVLKVYSSTFNQSRNPRNTSAAAKLKAIELQAEATLKALTRQAEISGATKWWDWWNDSGKKAREW